MKDVKEKVINAQAKLEEIRKQKVSFQESIRQLELNEAAWMGFIEALTPYVEDVPLESSDLELA